MVQDTRDGSAYVIALSSVAAIGGFLFGFEGLWRCPAPPTG